MTFARGQMDFAPNGKNITMESRDFFIAFLRDSMVRALAVYNF
jgi:hypothetical protein